LHKIRQPEATHEFGPFERKPPIKKMGKINQVRIFFLFSLGTLVDTLRSRRVEHMMITYMQIIYISALIIVIIGNKHLTCAMICVCVHQVANLCFVSEKKEEEKEKENQIRMVIEYNFVHSYNSYQCDKPFLLFCSDLNQTISFSDKRLR
jgi:D-alanyl-lipoteichoic acid acyltransferase DltB (MBOAT superfamily)